MVVIKRDRETEPRTERLPMNSSEKRLYSESKEDTKKESEEENWERTVSKILKEKGTSEVKYCP